MKDNAVQAASIKIVLYLSLIMGCSFFKIKVDDKIYVFVSYLAIRFILISNRCLNFFSVFGIGIAIAVENRNRIEKSRKTKKTIAKAIPIPIPMEMGCTEIVFLIAIENQAFTIRSILK